MKTSLFVATCFLALLPFSMGLCGCKKCPEKNESKTYEYEEEKDKAALGFLGNETLTYVKNNKDTVRFVGSGIQNYYTSDTKPAGDCQKDYKYAHRKVIFKNTIEGDIIFHYFYTGAFEISYEVVFTRNLIGPLNSVVISDVKPIVLYIKNKSFTNIKPFANENDSAYLYSTTDDLPIYRLPRIKLNNNIYEVIPL